MSLVLYFKDSVFKLIDDVTQKQIISSENIADVVNSIGAEALVTVYIDADEFYVRKVSLPAIGEEKVKDILPVEMEGKFLIPAKELCFGLVFLEKEVESDSYLVFGIKKKLIIDILTPLLNKGVKILKVSISRVEVFSEQLEGLDSNKIKELNFFPEELKKYSEKKLAFGTLKKLVLYASAICVIIILGLSLRLYFLLKKENMLKKDIIARYNTVFSESKANNLSVNVILSKIKELKQNYRSLKGIELLDILKDLSVTINNLTVKEINIENNMVTIKGESKDYASVEQYKNAIKKSFPLIKITETKNLSDGRMTFVMEALIGE